MDSREEIERRCARRLRWCVALLAAIDIGLVLLALLLTRW